jgi:hypothetical protein
MFVDSPTITRWFTRMTVYYIEEKTPEVEDKFITSHQRGAPPIGELSWGAM